MRENSRQGYSVDVVTFTSLIEGDDPMRLSDETIKGICPRIGILMLASSIPHERKID